MATIGQAAKHIFRSARYFATLLDSGVITRAPRGDYNLDTVRKEFIAHLSDVKQGIEGGGKSKLSDARARSASANASKAEFELEVQQGRWCESEVVVKNSIAEIVLVRENFLSAAGKICDPLHQVDREQAYDIVDTEIRECLGRLGGGQPGVEFAIEMLERSGGKLNSKLLKLLNELLLDDEKEKDDA